MVLSKPFRTDGTILKDWMLLLNSNVLLKPFRTDGTIFKIWFFISNPMFYWKRSVRTAPSLRFDTSSQFQCVIETVPYDRHHSSRFGSSTQTQCFIENVPYGRHHSSIFSSSQMQCLLCSVHTEHMPGIRSWKDTWSSVVVSRNSKLTVAPA